MYARSDRTEILFGLSCRSGRRAERNFTAACQVRVDMRLISCHDRRGREATYGLKR